MQCPYFFNFNARKIRFFIQSKLEFKFVYISKFYSACGDQDFKFKQHWAGVIFLCTQ